MSSPRAPNAAPRWMGLASVAIVIHLTAVLVALSANWAPSALQDRTLVVMRPYVGALRLDPDGAPLWLARDADREEQEPKENSVDFTLEVLPEGDNVEWQRIDTRWPRGSEPRHRYQRLARELILSVDADEITGRIVRDLAAHELAARGTRIARVRARRHLPQYPPDMVGLNAGRVSADDPSYFADGYQAAVLYAPEGAEVDVVRLGPSKEAAQPGAAP